MPLTVAEGALLGTGMLLVSGATLAYKRKQTAAFKALYFLSWPTLGSALLWTCMPSKERMEQVGQGGRVVGWHRVCCFGAGAFFCPVAFLLCLAVLGRRALW
jgi:hypothetical protein